MTTAYLFPGQGSQHVGMGEAVCARHPQAQAIFQLADETLGFPLTRLCRQGPSERLLATEVAQPALLTHGVAVAHALREMGFAAPQAVAGHSLGEWTALVVANALSFEDAVRLVHLRGRLMQEAVPAGEGAMAAVLGLDGEAVSALCDAIHTDASVVTPATFNAPRHVVVAGHAHAVARLEDAARAAGAMKVMSLEVSAPFHCSLMSPAAEPLAQALDEVVLHAPDIPVRSTTVNGWLETPDDIRRALVSQLTAPVIWDPCVRALHDSGIDQAWVLGAGRSLSRMVQRLRLGWKVRWVDSTEGEVPQGPSARRASL